jgi:hypothetical protein
MIVGKITVFLNVFKHEDDKNNQPVYRGKMDIDGKTRHVSLWINKEINGLPINMSGQITDGED